MSAKKGGFTLLELLVVMVISGLIVLTMTQVFRSIIRNTGRTASKIEDILYKSGRNRVIWKQIASQIAYRNTTSSPPFAYGTSDSLLLVSPFSLTDNYRKGLVIAYYLVQMDHNKKYTLRCWELPLKDDTFIDNFSDEFIALKEKKVFNLLNFINRQPDKQEITLIKNARNISFKFLYISSDNKKQAVWKEQWQNELAPRAVLIDIINSKGESIKITVPMPDIS